MTNEKIEKGSLWTERDRRFVKRVVRVEGVTGDKMPRVIIRTITNEKGESVLTNRTSKVRADVFRKRFDPKS